ncbi:MAG TPA: hypothetical protein VKR06_32360 [Ktedonosporobacter sp.]|nr:hypothetical protein [Ktedonosporobacter sp.]
MQPQPPSSPQWSSAPGAPPIPALPPMPITPPLPPGPGWGMLKFIAVSLKVVAWLFVALVVGGACLSFTGLAFTMAIASRMGGSGSSSAGPTIIAILVMLGVMLVTALIFLFLYAISDLILLMINIENNTRYRRI